MHTVLRVTASFAFVLNMKQKPLRNLSCPIITFKWMEMGVSKEQEGHDGPVSLHWLIREIHTYQTLHYLGIGLKHKTPYKD